MEKITDEELLNFFKAFWVDMLSTKEEKRIGVAQGYILKLRSLLSKETKKGGKNG